MAINVVPVNTGGGGGSPQQSVMSTPQVRIAQHPGSDPWGNANKGLQAMLPYIMKAMDRNREKGENSELAKSLIESGMGGNLVERLKAHQPDTGLGEMPSGGPGSGNFQTNVGEPTGYNPDPKQMQITSLLRKGQESGNIDMIRAAQGLSSTYQTGQGEESRFQRGQEAQDERFGKQQSFFNEQYKERTDDTRKYARELRDEGWGRDDAKDMLKLDRDDRLRTDRWSREDEIRRAEHKIKREDKAFDREYEKGEWTKRNRIRAEEATASVESANRFKEKQSAEVQKRWEGSRLKMEDGNWYSMSDLKTLHKLENSMYDEVDIAMAVDPSRKEEMYAHNKTAMANFPKWLAKKQGVKSSDKKITPITDYSKLSDKELTDLINK